MSPTGLSPSRFYARAFGVLTFAGLGYLLWKTLSPFAGAILWATLMAYMLHPLNVRLNARWKRPALSAGLLTAAVTLVVAGPVTVFLFALVRQATELLARLRTEAHDRQLPALQLVLELKPVQALLSAAGEFTSLSKDQIVTGAAEAAQTVLERIASLSGTVLVSAFSSVTQFGLTMFLLFFFLRDGREMLALAVRLVPMTEERKGDLSTHLGSVARAVVMGTGITALVQGTLLGIGFAIAGIPSPLVFGAVGALAALVPVVGTTLVWVPAVVTLLAQGHTGWAVFLAIWCVVLVAGSDNVVRPWLISGSASISPLLVFIGVLGGVGTFGFAGLFMGPLLLTLVAALLRYADESRVARGSGIFEPVRAGVSTPMPSPAAPPLEPPAAPKPAPQPEAPAPKQKEP